MKKILLFGMLAFATAGGAWAFYPKESQASGYMMVISRFSGSGFSSKGSIITVTPDGQTQTQEVETKTGTINKVTGSLDQLNISELKTLNELRSAGWRMKSATPVVLGGGTVTETVYLLEKE